MEDQIKLSGGGSEVVQALLTFVHTDALIESSWVESDPEIVMELLVLANQVRSEG